MQPYSDEAVEPGTAKLPDERLSPEQLDAATLWTVLRSLFETVRAIATARHSQIMGTAIVLLLLWGTHGRVDLLGTVLPGWTGPGTAGDPRRAQLIPGLPWDQEWISFGIGALLLVVIPVLIIKFWFRESLSDYGLGLPKPNRVRYTIWSTVFLTVLMVPLVYFSSRDASMRATYPFFRQFDSLGAFLLYELGYGVFFLVIEFIFRGYLLFGLYGAHHPQGMSGARESRELPMLNHYAILISMLAYCTWHLGKPIPEYWGTLMFGVVTGTIALTSGTIWHIVLVHWLVNVWLDYLIWTS